MGDSDFHLDPATFPKRLDLTLSAELEAELSRWAERSGRSLDELIVELLDRAIQSNPEFSDSDSNN